MSAQHSQPNGISASYVAPTAWSDVSPHSHLVQFYENDGFLIDSLARWFGDGLDAGDTCIFVGTEAHRISLEKYLKDRGIDLDLMRARRRCVCLDAASTLATFMVDGWPDEARFVRTLQEILAGVSRQGDRRVFGEMVALLWKDGNRQAAIRLEEIWNAFMRTHTLSLCCAYPINSFGTDADASLFMKVCAQHTPVLPAESYSALATPAERLRAVSLLQHKARTLEAEKAGRKKAEKSLQRRQKELSDFFENAVEGLQQLGPRANILWANPAQLKLLGYFADEYVGHWLERILR